MRVPISNCRFLICSVSWVDSCCNPATAVVFRVRLQLADVVDVARSYGIGQLHCVPTRRSLGLELQDLSTEWRNCHELFDSECPQWW